MPINFDCAVCKHRIRVPDGSEGKRTKCPKCQAMQPVPDPSEDEFRLKEDPEAEASRGEPSPKSDPFAGFSPQPRQKSSSVSDPFAGSEGSNAENPFASPTAQGQNPELARGRSEAEEKLKLPVLASMITLGLGVVVNILAFFWVVATVLAAQPNQAMMQLVVQVISLVFAVALQGLAFFGLKHAKDLGNYGLAWAGFILTALPCTSNLCCIISLPFCVWGMILLVDNSIQRHFSS